MQEIALITLWCKSPIIVARWNNEIRYGGAKELLQWDAGLLVGLMNLHGLIIQLNSVAYR
jgi:hypothetical protein